MQSKVVIFTTGGTIAMRYDPETGGSVPAVSGPELVAAVPPLASVCPVEVREFSNIPSPHMTPRLMLDLARQVEEALAEPDVLGAVITHGTDTLEETAYFLDMYLDSPKPVCLTAAMRGAGDISADGPKNIFDAVRCAASPLARDKGALVVMNEEIHAARDVAKTHSGNVATFASPCWGALGYVDEDGVLFRRALPAGKKFRPEFLEENVHIAALGAGSDGTIIDALVRGGAKGLVVQAFGRGNVPPSVFAAMKRAMDAGVAVVTVTRCPSGRVLGVYAYDGGFVPQREAGVLSGGELSAWKARLRLMLALGVSCEKAALAEAFEGV